MVIHVWLLVFGQRGRIPTKDFSMLKSMFDIYGG